MGLLDMIQKDPEKLEALRQGIISTGIQMLAGGRQDFGSSLGQGLLSGMGAYNSQRELYKKEAEKAKQKQAQAQAIQAATLPGRPAIPARAAVPAQTVYKPAPGNEPMMPAMNGQNAPLMSYMDYSPEMQAEQTPEIPAVQGQEAQAGGFDFSKFVQSSMMNPDSPDRDMALKYMASQKDPAENKPQLVTVYGADGRPMQKWVRPGESNGVDVGMGKPDSGSSSALGKLIAERDAIPEGHPARRLYDQAIDKAATHAPAAQLNNYGSPVAGVGPDGQPVFFQTSKGGGAPSIVQGVAPMPKEKAPYTEAENNSAGYLGRMQAAEKTLGGLQGGELTEGTALAGAVPFIGDYAQRKSMNPTQQKYKQATDDWIRAKLRKESGAVIGADESAAEYRTYFPQPGDGPGVIAQKAQARKQAESQIMQSAGRAGADMQARDDARYAQKPFSKSELAYIAAQRARGVPDTDIIRALNALNQKKPVPLKAGGVKFLGFE